MKMALDILTLVVIFYWFAMCMMSPMALAAHGAYEKEIIKFGLILSYPIVIFSIYYYFNANFFSYPAKTALLWSSVVAGTPVSFILLYAVKSLLQSKYVDAVLFASLEGVLTFEGKPAAGAKITRWVRLREDEPTEDNVFTNDKGEFNFPIMRRRIRISPIAIYSIFKFIRVDYEKQEFLIRSKDEDTYTMNTDTNVKPLKLKCELTNEHNQF